MNKSFFNNDTQSSYLPKFDAQRIKIYKNPNKIILFIFLAKYTFFYKSLIKLA